MRIPNNRALTVGLLAALILGGCGPWNGPYAVVTASEVHPRLSARDAVRISREYLDAQTPEIAAREMHVPPMITAVWAVRAADAASIDGCIAAASDGDAVVWVTKGHGDYLNLVDRAWSRSSSREPRLECGTPSTQGTLVIDDATGSILGVFPGERLAGSAFGRGLTTTERSRR